MTELSLNQKVYIHEHEKPYGGSADQCVGQIGLIIQLASGKIPLTIRCEVCGREDVSPEYSRDPDHPLPRIE